MSLFGHSTEVWLRGLIAAAINSAANVVTVIIVDPVKFSPATAGGWKNLGAIVLVSIVFGVSLYLKQSPLPPIEEPESKP